MLVLVAGAVGAVVLILTYWSLPRLKYVPLTLGVVVSALAIVTIPVAAAVVKVTAVPAVASFRPLTELRCKPWLLQPWSPAVRRLRRPSHW